MSLLEELLQRLSAVRAAAPATADECSIAEASLGVVLPAPLRDLYCQVGNGGFGPGYGVLGLNGGATDDQGKTALETYRVFMLPDPDAPDGADVWWREAHLPLCYWGCVVYTAVDCRTPEARVVGFDEGTWIADERTLTQWLSDWLENPGMSQPMP